MERSGDVRKVLGRFRAELEHRQRWERVSLGKAHSEAVRGIEREAEAAYRNGMEGSQERAVLAAEHAGSVVDVRGVAADGQPLALDGSRVSGLVPGTNTLEITVTAEDGTTTAGYTVAVTRARPAAAVLRFDLPGIGVAGVGASPPVRDALFPARREGGESAPPRRTPGLIAPTILSAPEPTMRARRGRDIVWRDLSAMHG